MISAGSPSPIGGGGAGKILGWSPLSACYQSRLRLTALRTLSSAQLGIGFPMCHSPAANSVDAPMARLCSGVKLSSRPQRLHSMLMVARVSSSGVEETSPILKHWLLSPATTDPSAEIDGVQCPDLPSMASTRSLAIASR